MTTLPPHYRAQAGTLRRLAQAVEDPRERARFFDFAGEYEKLAAYAQRGAEVRAEHVSATKVRAAVGG